MGSACVCVRASLPIYTYTFTYIHVYIPLRPESQTNKFYTYTIWWFVNKGCLAGLGGGGPAMSIIRVCASISLYIYMYTYVPRAQATHFIRIPYGDFLWGLLGRLRGWRAGHEHQTCLYDTPTLTRHYIIQCCTRSYYAMRCYAIQNKTITWYTILYTTSYMYHTLYMICFIVHSV